MHEQSGVDQDSRRELRERQYRICTVICLFGGIVAAVIVGIWVKFFGAPVIYFWYAFVAVVAPLVFFASMSVATAPALKRN